MHNKNMIHFVCEAETNKILKIYKQYNRACRFINENTHVLSYNYEIYPIILNFEVGNCINKFKIEDSKWN
jgi:hypothetical protein